MIRPLHYAVSKAGLVLVTLFLGSVLTHAAPSVSNVRAAQRPASKFVDVWYTLGGSGPATITLEVSSDGGASYTVPAATFSGDVGPGIQPGEHHAVWNAGIDWNGQFTARGRVRVIAEEASGPAGMAYIPAGRFQMGDNLDGMTDAPLRSVYVSEFWLERYEVTYELWERVVQWGTRNGYVFSGMGEGFGPKHPVVNLAWLDIIKWLNARSQMEGRIPVYFTSSGKTDVYQSGEINLTEAMVKWDANGYRLPTEAEWEKAARGGFTGRRYPWGNTFEGWHGNYLGSNDPFEANSLGTTPVGYYNGHQVPSGTDMANGYGLYDMAGNVWEWCWDVYGAYPEGDLSNPRGAPFGFIRAIRGGGWGADPLFARCATRNGDDPHIRVNTHVGFRCALSRP